MTHVTCSPLGLHVFAHLRPCPSTHPCSTPPPRQHTRYVNASATLAGKLRSATHKVRAAARAAVPAPASKGGAGQGQGQQHEAPPHGGLEDAEHYDGEEEDEDEDDEAEEQHHEEVGGPGVRSRIGL